MNKVIWSVFLFFAFVFPALSQETGSSASRPSGSRAGVGIVIVQGTEHAVPSDLADAINSGDWGNLTLAQLAQAGITPGMTAPGGGRPITHVSHRLEQGFEPESAIGCTGLFNSRVCIYVYGKSLHVDRWNAAWLRFFGSPPYVCTFAAYWVNNNIIETTNQACGNGSFYTYWTPNRDFPDHSQVCNTYVGVASKPCETIHK